jgi:hypothetical protein
VIEGGLRMLFLVSEDERMELELLFEFSKHKVEVLDDLEKAISVYTRIISIGDIDFDFVFVNLDKMFDDSIKLVKFIREFERENFLGKSRIVGVSLTDDYFFKKNVFHLGIDHVVKQLNYDSLSSFKDDLRNYFYI